MSGGHCAVLYGEDLVRFAEPVKEFRTREISGRLTDYLYSPVNDRVFILYGLRLTGKTTMIRQAILRMDDEHRKKTAFVQVKPGATMEELYRELKGLEEAGLRYVFIDEVTLAEDFTREAAILSDIFAASGMKIILSGDDSMGFLLAAKDQLFDRCIMLHTTFIPYREAEHVLGIRGIEEYIRCSGTMSPDRNIFATEESAREYIDSAIVENIQHSLKKESEQEGKIQEYLRLLDVIETVDVVNDADVNQSRKHVIFTQPGIRFALASAAAAECIPDEIRDRMIKDIVLLETKKARPDLQVFVLRFAAGEFDMVTADPRALTCSIYEIRNSREVSPECAGLLDDDGRCARTEKQYGDIEGKYVIYRGPSFTEGDIHYLNVEEYLKSLGWSAMYKGYIA